MSISNTWKDAAERSYKREHEVYDLINLALKLEMDGEARIYLKRARDILGCKDLNKPEVEA